VMLSRRNVEAVRWPLAFITTVSLMPARTMLQMPLRRRSWTRAPGRPASLRARSHGLRNSRPGAAPRCVRIIGMCSRPTKGRPGVAQGYISAIGAGKKNIGVETLRGWPAPSACRCRVAGVRRPPQMKRAIIVGVAVLPIGSEATSFGDSRASRQR
jgi:hypothetical protein